MTGRTAKPRTAFALAAALVVSTLLSLAPAATDHVEAASSTSKLVPIGPIRLADTRRSPCGCTRIDHDTISIDVTGLDAVPDEAIAAAVTVTALRTPTPGYVTIFPSGVERPTASTANTGPDRTVANSSIVPLGADGALTVFLSEAGGVVVDLTAVFVPAAHSRDGRFVPVAGRRLVDTRTATPPSGPLPAGGELDVPLPTEVGADAIALMVNVTSVHERAPGHLSVRPAGSEPTDTSILNPDGSGHAVAGSTIVAVSEHGFVIDSFRGGDVVVDLLGWFTGPNARDHTDGLYVPVEPARILDTRTSSDRIHAGGTIELASPVADAAAIVANVTAVRPDRAGFVTAYPAGTTVPGTSTVNPSSWNHTVANLAITQVSVRGLAYRSFAGTDLIVDMTGWFTGRPVAAPHPTAPNPSSRSRVLLVGDSTLAALEVFPTATAAFVGFDGVVDAKSCRRLERPSCRSDVTGHVPNTAVEAISTTPGPFDIVVVKTGYNDWFSDFPAEFDAVVQAARANGAHTIIWLTYNVDVARPLARRAYEENNADLRSLVTDPRYSDVQLADWLAYSGPRQDWFVDGTHLTTSGTWAIADYISRWVAAIEHRPCPRPWALDWPTPDPCPAPDLVGAPADPQALY